MDTHAKFRMGKRRIYCIIKSFTSWHKCRRPKASPLDTLRHCLINEWMPPEVICIDQNIIFKHLIPHFKI